MGVLNTTSELFGLPWSDFGKLLINANICYWPIFMHPHSKCEKIVYDELSTVPLDQLTLDRVVDAVKMVVREDLHKIILPPTIDKSETLEGDPIFTIKVHYWAGFGIRDVMAISFFPNTDNLQYVYNELLRICNTEAQKCGLTAKFTPIKGLSAVNIQFLAPE